MVFANVEAFSRKVENCRDFVLQAAPELEAKLGGHGMKNGRPLSVVAVPTKIASFSAERNLNFAAQKFVL